MCEDCDWPSFIVCCCEILCICCVNCADNDTPKYGNTQETNFTNPANLNGTYTAQQPLNQGYPYSPQQYPGQQYSPQEYSPQQFPPQQYPPQNFGAQQYPTYPNSGLNPSAPLIENNFPSNPSSGGMTSSNYPAPPPSYSEAVGMETFKAQSPNSPEKHIAKA